ncbi:helix-turn-helix domain-containing protein [Verrucomicrobium sp. 3C]|uniref:helix-turn-helix domain-containing protein n=1 Tax=Verrucomicrobium sp. 3C TaxID=1134055 RepID=UPI00037821DA|nr:helix-turn-helix domain-containing protein [Verrucomicrobium sp. 3C]
MSDATPSKKEWMGPDDVAELLGISKRLVLDLWRAGVLPGVKLSRKRIRFRRAAIEEKLAALTEGKR